MTLKWEHLHSVFQHWASVEYKEESKVTCFDGDTHLLDIYIYSGQSHPRYQPSHSSHKIGNDSACLNQKLES